MKKITPRIFFSILVYCCSQWAIAQGSFDYSDVLGKSIEFYDGQICGPQPSWSRAAWRNDCHMNDGSDVGANLTGGWHDAGDHTKFNYVSAQATRVLAWSYLQYQNAFDNTGNRTHLLNHLRLSGDFMIKLHPSPNVFHAQIGRAKTGNNPEHNEWVAPSLQSANIDRSTISINSSNPGTHMAASNAAAFASLAMVFQNSDASYSATLLQHARDLFNFADQNRGSHYDLLGSPEPYPMNDFDDDLLVAAIWLYKATNENQFLTRAETEYNKVSNNTGWMMHYRDHAYEGYLLMAQITGEQKYYTSAEAWLDNEIDNAPRSGGGLYYRSDFLPASLAQSMAFGAFFYAELRGSGFSKYNKYRNFAFQQIDYVLGDNPRNSSYVVGYGNNPTTITHHRGASGVPQGSAAADTHVHVGSLAGGPRQDDSFNEVRTDVKSTEPAISQQAFFVGMAAMMVKETGADTPGTEGSVEIENNFSVFNETGSNNTVAIDNGNPGASNGQYVRLFDTNDELSTTFSVGEAGDYKLDLRVRTGEQSSNSTNNLASQYEVRVDGTVRNFSFVSGSASALDGDTYWGLISRTQNLSQGNHTIRIKAKSNWLKADRLDFEKQTTNPGGGDIFGEIGNTTANHEWKTVNYANNYTDPIVILGPVSTFGGDKTSVRVRSTDGNSFQWRVDEWEYRDENHATENAGYMVVESGLHTLSNGKQIAAGTASVGTGLVTVNLPAEINGIPIIFAEVQTENEAQAVAVRVRNVTNSSFQMQLQEEENGGTENGSRAHVAETVAWVAMETTVASGTNIDKFEVAASANTVTANDYQINFTQSYNSSDKVFIGHDQTTDGGDVGTIRYRQNSTTNSLTANGVKVFFEEEQSKDEELGHTSEVFGYVIFDGDGNLSGTSDGGGTPSGTIVVRAKGDCGSETMQLRVNGSLVQTWNNVGTAFSNYSYDGFTSGEVSVHFTNDGGDGSCGDRNLEVDWIEVCGTRLQTETEATETSNCCQNDPDKLYTDGDFNFGNRTCGASYKAVLPEASSELTGITVFPNPVSNGTLNIRAESSFKVQLFDLLGREVFGSEELQAGIRRISLEGVSNGLYLLKVTDASSLRSTSSKLLIE